MAESPQRSSEQRRNILFQCEYKNVEDEIRNPDDVLTELYGHQKQALFWMRERENSIELPPFWEERNGVFLHTLTGEETPHRPEALRGGILADEEGLGKTLTLISLIALDKCRNVDELPSGAACGSVSGSVSGGFVSASVGSSSGSTSASVGSSSDSVSASVGSSSGPVSVSVGSSSASSSASGGRKQKKKRRGSPPLLFRGILLRFAYWKAKRGQGKIKGKRKKKTTLVVTTYDSCKAWAELLIEHSKLSFHEHLDAHHNDVNVHDYDVILTTHELIHYASVNCPESFLEKVHWWRLILDDVRCDKWPECRDALAEFPSMLLLQAKRKWVVARKPIFVSHVYAFMVYLLGLDNPTERFFFSVSDYDEEALRLKQDFMKAVCLQRKRGQVVRGFTTDVLVIYAHELTPNERAKYDIQANFARVHFRKAVDEGNINDVFRVYVNVSLMSMICGGLAPCYPQYTPTLKFFPSASEAAGLLEKAAELQQRREECTVCLSYPAVNAITKCGHHFCIECIETVVTRLHICPNCRVPLEVCDVYLPDGSSKLSALLRLLEASREAQAATKSIVYTEDDAMLKYMEANIRRAGFHVLCLSLQQLEDNGQPVLDFDDESVIAEFKERGEKEHVVLLATRKQRLAGICRNCTIYFMEPWGFDMPKVDAVDLLYRARQENGKIVMFFSKDTVQERMMYHAVIEPIVFQALQLSEEDSEDLSFDTGQLQCMLF